MLDISSKPGPSIGHNGGPWWFRKNWIPSDADAVIRGPTRSVMTSANVRMRCGWVLTFERRTAPTIEPLMGWTGGDDTMTQVRLNFPTRAAAVAFANRQNLNFRVEGAARESAPTMDSRGAIAVDGGIE